MPPRPAPVATLRLAHAGRANDITNAAVTQVQRPATGWAAHPLTCHVCGQRFTVEVCSLSDLTTVVRRRRTLQGLAGLGAGALLLAAAVLAGQAAVVVGVVLGILGGLAVLVAAAHLAITPYYQGISPPRRESDGKVLQLPGPADHRIF
ncbi:hypothetical protein LG943_03645 [Streptomonospora sp. S1-112]|uniref:Uncharacterized protein n=1 Tax=Streptomonospora mangrovi TaxID=2883123 RepID=A0A9X3SLK8_9ACTN|nr:hypothetical protein [Streptomonospora mangrovi]MDA0563426.1 hypothetical protein [Streptomonospora mangrovi]